MSRLYSNIQKWLQTIKISIARMMAYRLNFFLLVLGPSLVFFFIKYSLWTSIYATSSRSIISGFNLQQMLEYHAWGLVIALLAQAHASMDMAQEIRLGKISSYLIYPFDFWEFHSASFIGLQIVQFFISIITLFVFFNLSIIKIYSLSQIALGLLFSIVVGIFWFSFQYFFGLLAFWLDETWILRVLFSLISNFLSGQIIPLNFFSQDIHQLLDFTPFPYLSYYPIKIFMGDIHIIDRIPHALGILLFWFCILVCSNTILWKKGLNNYTASGI